jgi:hypothetical protein
MIRPDHNTAPPEAGSRLAIASLVAGVINLAVTGVFRLSISVFAAIAHYDEAQVSGFFVTLINDIPQLAIAANIFLPFCMLIGPFAALGGLIMGIVSDPVQEQRGVRTLGIVINLIMLMLAICPAVIAIADSAVNTLLQR